jgi:hypothetical protein
MKDVKPGRSGFFSRSQGRQQRLELFAALTAHVQVLLDQRHGLGGVQPRELHLYKEIYPVEALVAADLLSLTGLGNLIYERSENIFVKQRARSS